MLPFGLFSIFFFKILDFLLHQYCSATSCCSLFLCYINRWSKTLALIMYIISCCSLMCSEAVWHNLSRKENHRKGQVPQMFQRELLPSTSHSCYLAPFYVLSSWLTSLLNLQKTSFRAGTFDICRKREVKWWTSKEREESTSKLEKALTVS